MSGCRRTRGLRASDVERDEVVARLGLACGQGRVTVDELAERLAAVYRVEFRDELEEIVADLPERPSMAGMYRRVAELLADARWLGITHGELVALVLASKRPSTCPVERRRQAAL